MGAEREVRRGGTQTKTRLGDGHLPYLLQLTRIPSVVSCSLLAALTSRLIIVCSHPLTAFPRTATTPSR